MNLDDSFNKKKMKKWNCVYVEKKKKIIIFFFLCLTIRQINYGISSEKNKNKIKSELIRNFQKKKKIKKKLCFI